MIFAANTTWYVARAGGTLAFALLTASVVLGLLLSRKDRVSSWPRFALEDVHRFVGLLAGTFIVIHGGALLLDGYLPFSLANLVVPFSAPTGRSRCRPEWSPPSCSPRSRSRTTTASRCRTRSGGRPTT